MYCVSGLCLTNAALLEAQTALRSKFADEDSTDTDWRQVVQPQLRKGYLSSHTTQLLVLGNGQIPEVDPVWILSLCQLSMVQRNAVSFVDAASENVLFDMHQMVIQIEEDLEDDSFELPARLGFRAWACLIFADAHFHQR